MRDPLVVALAQINSVLGEYRTNIEKIEAFTKDAVSQGADIIVFPELSLSGYDYSYFDHIKKYSNAEFESLKEVAIKNKIGLVVPLPIFENERIYNGAIVFDKKGNVVGEYKKFFLWEDEENYFKPGREPLIFDFMGWKLSILVCYDAGFPEMSRYLALQGVEAILMPSAFEKPDRYKWNIYFNSRALENSIFIAAVNHIGIEGESNFFGHSKLIDPFGSVIVESLKKTEGIIVGELDKNLIQSAQEKNKYTENLTKNIKEFEKWKR